MTGRVGLEISGETRALVRALAMIEQRQWRARQRRLLDAGDPLALHVNIGIDIMSAATLAFAGGYQGTTATSPTATTFTTDAVNIPVNSVAGQYIITTSGAIRFGVIQSNTSATNSVLTIDRWYDASALPANVAVAAASTPTAGAWMIPPGQVPTSYIGLSATSTPAVTDTTLSGELAAAGGGLSRQLATYAHSAASGGAGTATLVKTFTTNGSDSIPVTVAGMAVFQGVVVAASRMAFKTTLNASATMSLSGDQLALTWTGTQS